MREFEEKVAPDLVDDFERTLWGWLAEGDKYGEFNTGPQQGRVHFLWGLKLIQFWGPP